MDFSKPANAPVGEGLPAKTDPVVEPAGAEMLITQPVIGPADSHGPECPNPMSVEAPGTDPIRSLVSELNWALPHRS